MMKNVNIMEGYQYLSESNIIVNNETTKLHPDINKIKKNTINDFHIDTELIKYSLKNISHLTFEVTQNCNLRCKYCINSEHYSSERNLSKQTMSYEIATNGLDYFFNAIKDRMNKVLVIGFYGGEPLLGFDLIKKIITYSKRIFSGWEIRYNMTTNATLMTSEMINFFIANSFSILISLDGPKEIHDAKRLFSDGEGSFDIVWKNISKISNTNMKYFKEKVKFNAVYSRDLPVLERIKFFNESSLLKDSFTISSFVNFLDTNYYEKYPYDEDRYVSEYQTLYRNLNEKLLRKEKIKSAENSFNPLKQLNGLEKKKFSTLWGACILSKPLIDATGNIHFCDQINSHLSFGDVFQGIDFNKLANIVNDFKKINQQFCQNCSFKFLCKRCYIRFCKNDSIDFNEEYCKSQKKTILDSLYNYVSFKKMETGIGKNQCSSQERYKFHQFISIDKGPVNSAIVDLIGGEVYQVENSIIEKFEKSDQTNIKDFIEALQNEKLIVKTRASTWIPRPVHEPIDIETKKMVEGNSFELEIEEGADLALIGQKFDNSIIRKISYYGTKKINDFFPSTPITYKEKNIDSCYKKSRVSGIFKKISEEKYFLNKSQNNCWGKRIAITTDCNVRPCIYSTVLICDLKEVGNVQEIFDEAWKYWTIIKNQIKKCKDCEFKYVCFDCREIAYRKNGDLYAANPLCKYDPYKGEWDEKQDNA